jgi:hypothetical protein
MRKLKLAMQVSVDGFTAGADGDTRWMVWNWTENWPWDDRLRTYHSDLTLSSDCILLSRKMAEGWGGTADFELNGHRFRLQDYYVQDWADNFMVFMGSDRPNQSCSLAEPGVTVLQAAPAGELDRSTARRTSRF